MKKLGVRAVQHSWDLTGSTNPASGTLAELSTWGSGQVDVGHDFSLKSCGRAVHQGEESPCR